MASELVVGRGHARSVGGQAGLRVPATASTTRVSSGPEGCGQVQRGLGGAAGGPEVHHRDSRPPAVRVPDEPVARHHLQRRAEHQQRASCVHRRERDRDPVARNLLTEEDDIGLEPIGTAREAVGNIHARFEILSQVDVTVGSDQAGQPANHLLQLRILRGHASLHGLACLLGPAPEADHSGEASVQLGDVHRTGCLVQAVDVLGDHLAHQAQRLQACDRPVPVVGPGRAEPLPADEPACPVPPPHRRCRHEVVEGHRRDPADAVGAAVGGDARLGREPGAGQDRHAAGPKEIGQPPFVVVRQRPRAPQRGRGCGSCAPWQLPVDGWFRPTTRVWPRSLAPVSASHTPSLASWIA